jgi:hypothetical protein
MNSSICFPEEDRSTNLVVSQQKAGAAQEPDKFGIGFATRVLR